MRDVEHITYRKIRKILLGQIRYHHICATTVLIAIEKVNAPEPDSLTPAALADSPPTRTVRQIGTVRGSSVAVATRWVKALFLFQNLSLMNSEEILTRWLTDERDYCRKFGFWEGYYCAGSSDFLLQHGVWYTPVPFPAVESGKGGQNTAS